MARSDDSSINTLCSRTEEPVICRACLQADPNSKSADGQGLALMAISCAERDTTFLHGDTFNLLQNATGHLKGILDDCTQRSFLAQQEFLPAARYVQEGQYDSAIDVIAEEIIPSVMYCLKLFDQNPEWPVPQLVLAGTVASNQTCRNAVEILRSI
ncbi:uncharacterized protein LOC129316759 [Prosopis cineraria]|uniref:uncharacterized protein LOC129316759 n=1 Tax=Prosopis cineraria TaxID=364024 RepID=UPI00240F1B0F|nr:uncharacterized protein LOC129316759 [Prosopis cineraria]